MPRPRPIPAPVTWAAHSAHTRAGADPNSTSSVGITPLQRAALYGKPAVVKLLLILRGGVGVYHPFPPPHPFPPTQKPPADPMRRPRPIPVPVTRPAGLATLRTGVEPTHLGRRPWMGDTALHWAAFCGACGAGTGVTPGRLLVAWLLAAGADPNAQDNDGATPLANARRCRSAKILELPETAAALR